MVRWPACLCAVALAGNPYPGLAQSPAAATVGQGAGMAAGSDDSYYEFVLRAEEADDAAAMIETWFGNARLQGAAAPQATALRVGDVDTLLELRGSGAWRDIRGRFDSDPEADITYAPEFGNAYVLTGSFLGTDAGFYELVLRDDERIASVSMYFPVGGDGKAVGDTRATVEAIACSVHFGRAALPCAQ